MEQSKTPSRALAPALMFRPQGEAMKVFFAIVVCSLFYGIAGTQTGNDPQRVIERMIDQGSLEGHDQKVLGTTGDAAAVLLTKVLAGKPLSTSQIDTSLLILNMAFADPRMVENASDRQPRTALFVLQAFDGLSQEASLRQRIAETRTYIQSRYAEALKSTPK